MIVVGGGNTFQLLKECRNAVAQAIRSRVAQAKPLPWLERGRQPRVPRSSTTNDMPIVDPGSLDALGLVPFQINPHYVNAVLPGHHGETRDERLEEFAHANPGLPVVGLPESDWLRVAGNSIALRGPYPATLVRARPRPCDGIAPLRRQRVDFRF